MKRLRIQLNLCELGGKKRPLTVTPSVTHGQKPQLYFPSVTFFIVFVPCGETPLPTIDPFYHFPWALFSRKLLLRGDQEK